MAKKIRFSETTKDFIVKLKQAQFIQFPVEFNQEEFGSKELIDLINWLKQKQQVDKETNFLVESLNNELLKQLYDSLFENKKEQKKKEAPGWSGKLKFILLAIAGTIYFGCEGFDGITALLGIFSLPALVIFLGGLVFSILSVLVFYAFGLVEISKNLGIQVKNAPKILDLYLKEVENIKALAKGLRDIFILHDSKELKDDLVLIQFLIFQYKALEEAREKVIQYKSNKFLTVAKYVVAGFAGVLFFSGGFFAGQTVALAIIAFFAFSATSFFWPVLLASIAVGFAAFSVYWFVERPGIENLVSHWFGLEQEKMDAFCGEEAVKRQLDKLEKLEKSIKYFSETTEKTESTIASLRYADVGSNPSIMQNQIDSIPIIPLVDSVPRSRSYDELSFLHGNNPNSFLSPSQRLKRTKSENNLVDTQHVDSLPAFSEAHV